MPSFWSMRGEDVVPTRCSGVFSDLLGPFQTVFLFSAHGKWDKVWPLINDDKCPIKLEGFPL